MLGSSYSASSAYQTKQSHKCSPINDITHSFQPTYLEFYNQERRAWFLVFLKLRYIRKLLNTGGPQILLFLRPQGTVLLRKSYYSGTDLVLKSWFMTFRFSKSPFFAHFQAILIFETKKMIIWLHFETWVIYHKFWHLYKTLGNFNL